MGESSPGRREAGLARSRKMAAGPAEGGTTGKAEAKDEAEGNEKGGDEAGEKDEADAGEDAGVRGRATTAGLDCLFYHSLCFHFLGGGLRRDASRVGRAGRG